MPVLVLWAAPDVVDRVALRHPGVGADLAIVRFLYEDEVSRGVHRRGYAKDCMGRGVRFVGILGEYEV